MACHSSNSRLLTKAALARWEPQALPQGVGRSNTSNFASVTRPFSPPFSQGVICCRPSTSTSTAVQRETDSWPADPTVTLLLSARGNLRPWLRGRQLPILGSCTKLTAGAARHAEEAVSRPTPKYFGKPLRQRNTLLYDRVWRVWLESAWRSRFTPVKSRRSR